MKKHVIPYIDHFKNWQDIPSLDISHLQWSEPTDISAEAKLFWDQSALHLLLRANEKNIRAELTDPLSMVSEDSCLEFFIQPLKNDKRYLNFEFNANAVIFLGICSSRKDIVRLLPLNYPAIFNPVVHKTEDGWEISFSVPFEFIKRFFPDFSPVSGLTFKGNFYKCGDRTVHPHFLSWNKIESETPNFHLSKDFGELILG